MTEQQLQVLKELEQDPDFKGKDALRHLIWRNTTVPKHQVGDMFYVSDYSRRLFGKQAIDIKAKVVKISTIRTEEEYKYELEAQVVSKETGKEITTSFFARERELVKKASDNMNTI